MQYGENFEKISKFLNLEKETWNRLMLLEKAKQLRIKVTDNEVVKYIQGFSFFERDGKFDNELYNTILKYVFRMKPRVFEEGMRESLKIQTLFGQATDQIIITDQDIMEAYKKMNEKVQVSYILITPEQFKPEVTYEEEEALAYYENNQAEFLMPPSIKAAYLSFPFIQEEQETVTDENSNEKPNEKNPEIEEQNEIIRQSVYEVYQALLENNDFTAIAKKFNLAIQVTDYFTMENPDFSLGWSYNILNSLFDMEIEETAEPIETNDGMHIVQLKDKKSSFIPEYNSVKEEAREALLLEKAKKIAKVKAKDYLDAVLEETNKTELDDFSEAAKTLGLEIHQTPLFNREQYLPKIGLSRGFQETAFSLTDDQNISSVVKTSIGYCILHLDNFEPINEESLEKEREELRVKLLDEQKNSVFADYLKSIRDEAKLLDLISKKKEQKN